MTVFSLPHFPAQKSGRAHLIRFRGLQHLLSYYYHIRYSTSASLHNFAAHTILSPSSCRHCSAPLLRPQYSNCPGVQAAVLYTDHYALPVYVATQSWCGTCKKFVPYDGVEDRVFNYNDVRLFTHQLLNSYTARYTSSQTTFNSFCHSMIRMYDEYKNPFSSIPFISVPTFILVWFSFVVVRLGAIAFNVLFADPNLQQSLQTASLSLFLLIIALVLFLLLQ